MIPRRKPLARGRPPRRRNPERRQRLDAKQFGPTRKVCAGLPCCVCFREGPSDPAHIFRGRGAGGEWKDNVAPLCRAHHAEQEGRTEAFERDHNVDLRVVCRVVSMTLFEVKDYLEELQAEGPQHSADCEDGCTSGCESRWEKTRAVVLARLGRLGD